MIRYFIKSRKAASGWFPGYFTLHEHEGDAPLPEHRPLEQGLIYRQGVIRSPRRPRLRYTGM